ncbi:hypothetical protein HK097_010116 [Rhizophlyctis rosea]|uniref:F-box domain-containing protein n=1 Tax=Rhizophlyctis rosea TaxID=64517 RepID=A0AAD5SFY1_9FUNG|nr:hypothetical protein HK097_010116 [Rhizophlyctis rosea]
MTKPLPTELLIPILKRLDIPTTFKSEQVCKRWLDVISTLWKDKVCEVFPVGCAPVLHGEEIWRDLAVIWCAWSLKWEVSSLCTKEALEAPSEDVAQISRGETESVVGVLKGVPERLNAVSLGSDLWYRNEHEVGKIYKTDLLSTSPPTTLTNFPIHYPLNCQLYQSRRSNWRIMSDTQWSNLTQYVTFSPPEEGAKHQNIWPLPPDAFYDDYIDVNLYLYNTTTQNRYSLKWLVGRIDWRGSLCAGDIVDLEICGSILKGVYRSVENQILEHEVKFWRIDQPDVNTPPTLHHLWTEPGGNWESQVPQFYFNETMAVKVELPTPEITKIDLTLLEISTRKVMSRKFLTFSRNDSFLLTRTHFYHYSDFRYLHIVSIPDLQTVYTLDMRHLLGDSVYDDYGMFLPDFWALTSSEDGSLLLFEYQEQDSDDDQSRVGRVILDAREREVVKVVRPGRNEDGADDGVFVIVRENSMSGTQVRDWQMDMGEESAFGGRCCGFGIDTVYYKRDVHL